MKMNKKGIIFVVPLAVGIIAIISLFLLLTFGTAFLLNYIKENSILLVGIGVLVGFFIALINGMKTGFTQNKMVILFVILSIGIFFVFGANILQTALSISNLQFLSSNPEDKLIILATPDGENVIVDLNEKALNEKLNIDGYQVSRGVKIEAQLTSFKEIYNIEKVEKDIFYKLNEKDIGNANAFNLGLKTFEQSCQNAVGNDIYLSYYLHEEGGFSVANLICIYKNAVGTRAKIQGDVFDDFIIKVSANDESKDLTRNNQKVSLLNNNVVVAFQFEGSAPQGIKQVNQDILFKDSSYQYLIDTTASQVAGDQMLLSNYNSCTSAVKRDKLGSESKIKTCINTWNNNMDSKLTNTNDKFAPSIVESISFNTKDANHGELVANIRKGTTTKIPVLRIEVNGKFLGVERLSGIPKIESCIKDINTDSGNEEDLQKDFSLTNKGTKRAVFSLSGVCNNDKIRLLLPNEITIDSLSDVNVRATITGVSERKDTTEKANCVINVQDKNGDKSDSCNFNVNIKFNDIICSPNQQYCSTDFKSILKCGNLGNTKDELVKDCESGAGCGLNDRGQIGCYKKSIFGVIESPNTLPETQIEENKSQVSPLDCKFYEVYTPSKSETSSILGLKKTTTETPAQCKVSPLAYILIFAIGLVLLISIITLVNKKK